MIYLVYNHCKQKIYIYIYLWNEMLCTSRQEGFVNVKLKMRPTLYKNISASCSFSRKQTSFILLVFFLISATKSKNTHRNLRNLNFE